MNDPRPRAGNGKLKPREEQFCAEYVVDFVGSAAARRAGVPEKGAKVWACRALAMEPIQERIAELMAKRAERTGITGDRVIAELGCVGFSRVTDFMRITKDGEPAIDLSDLTDDQKAAIAEVTVEDFTSGRGDDAREVRRVRFKLHNKVDALVNLGRHLGIFEKDNKQRVPLNEAERLAKVDAEIEEAMRGGDSQSGEPASDKD